MIRTGMTEFSYTCTVQPRPKLGAWLEDLNRRLAINAGRASRERLTLMHVYEGLRGLGYEGGYDVVRRYASVWKRGQSSGVSSAFVPLSFAPGRSLPLRLEPRDRADRRRHHHDQGCACPPVPQPGVPRPGLSARDAGASAIGLGPMAPRWLRCSTPMTGPLPSSRALARAGSTTT